jgi:hypothetical protein
LDELWERMFVALAFSVFGPIIEVLCTGIAAWWHKSDERLRGYVSIVMFPAYAFVGFIFPSLYAFVGEYAWYARGSVYTCIGIPLEFFYGALLFGVTGRHFWEHKGPVHFRHHTDLRWFPVFFVGSLFLELVFWHVTRRWG